MAGLTIPEDEHRYPVTIAAVQEASRCRRVRICRLPQEKTEYLRYLSPAVAQSVTLMAQIPHLREAGQHFLITPRAPPEERRRERHMAVF